jgi:two-component system chemotaxis response regulator CheB
MSDTLEKNTLRSKVQIMKPDILAIGSSTGGPEALTKFFTNLKGKKINVPVVITQHMPAHFVESLADQISVQTGFECKVAEDGEEIKTGQIYIAKGEYHLLFEKKLGKIFAKLDQSAPENFCRPAVDPMLRSLSSIYKDKMMVVILTGMGADGLEGSKVVVANGGTVIAQDKESSVIWGMPGAVAKAGLCTEVAPIEKLVSFLAEYTHGSIR